MTHLKFGIQAKQKQSCLESIQTHADCNPIFPNPIKALYQFTEVDAGENPATRGSAQALPVRPVSRAPLPRARKQLPFDFKFVESIHEPALADSNGIRGIRGWLSRRHFNHIGHVQKIKIENERDVRNLPKDTDKKDCILVQHLALVDLQKQALRIEVKLQKKNEENSALKMQLQKMEDKWREYEEKMKSLENGKIN
ncbi:myosin-2 [Olea europaea subsp. europaea]|uniref:Myosin-2 n=1 Tax=Olea europaea subsp. europaea TaxID=158383 RepID=A0A8S0PDC0_OLEEU|nr:myosin-2 [Olea europaea subsp. europaea]